MDSGQEEAADLNFSMLDSVLQEYMPSAAIPSDSEVNPASQDLFPDMDHEQPGELMEDEQLQTQPGVNTDSVVEEFLRNSQPEDEPEDEEQEDSILSQGSTADELKQELDCEIRKGCGCGKNCLQKVDRDAVYRRVLDLREMTKNEKEMYIMGKIEALNIGDQTRQGDRKRLKYEYSLPGSGMEVCQRTFLVAHDMGIKQLKNILKHMKEKGAVPRTHGLVGHKPAKALTFQQTKGVVTFLENYATEHGLPLAAAPRASDDQPPVLLPADQTKKYVFDQYWMSSAPGSAVGLTSFKDIWKACVPHIKFINPREDVCATCEILRKELAVATQEEDKLAAAEAFTKHIRTAQEERSFYHDAVVASRQHFEEHGEAPQSVHYTFDFAQSVGLPHHVRQMGPTYFLSLRKVHIFGVCLEGVPVQHNYLFDESECIGRDGTMSHGANAVIAMLHHCLTEHGYGEQTAEIHADNCGGQNKNRYLMAYFSWRTMTGQHREINYHMQIPGHTKCIIDAGFGIAKQKFRRSDCDTLSQLATVFEQCSSSSRAHLFEPEPDQPVGSTWQWRDWTTFFSGTFREFRGIRQYQHFRFSVEHPGIVFAKTSVTAQEVEFTLARDPQQVFQAGDTPQVLLPKGLSADRTKYLYKSVRKYVHPDHQDDLCPAP